MSVKVYRDMNSVTTLLAIENQLTAALGIQMNYRPGSTINTKRGVLADVVPEAVPRIRYFGIGIKGYANITSENNISQPFRPNATDCDLYEPIPFRCVTTPLSSPEADQYVIRDVVVINSIQYYRYWLKKIEFETPSVKLTQVENAVEKEFTIDSTSLTPIPTDIYPRDVNEVQKRITASVTGVCRVTGKEVCEVINAMYDGDMRRARISEIGTYSGIPYHVGENANGLPAAEEAAYVQLCTHKCLLGQSLSDPSALYIDRKSFENSSTVII